jgi:hypothetical protein
MLRNRFDQFGKNILHDILRLRGEAQTEAEVPPGDAQRIDVWFVPEAARQRAGPRLTGALAALVEAPALIELWSECPQDKHFHACLRKRYAWHHTLEVRDKREWAMPPLWGISAGRPDGILDRFGFEPVPEGPAGSYRTAATGWQVRMIVVGELPRVRDTILLRLLGHRPVRRQAIADLKALAEDALERRVAQPWLVRLKLELEAADPTMLSADDKETAMDVQEWYEQFKRDLKHEWYEQFERDQAERFKAEGRTEGQLQTLIHQFERRLRRTLTLDERDRLAARVREQGAEHIGDIVLDSSPDELATWLTSTNGH